MTTFTERRAYAAADFLASARAQEARAASTVRSLELTRKTRRLSESEDRTLRCAQWQLEDARKIVAELEPRAAGLTLSPRRERRLFCSSPVEVR